jgi:hypothetical protein
MAVGILKFLWLRAMIGGDAISVPGFLRISGKYVSASITTLKIIREC